MELVINTPINTRNVEVAELSIIAVKRARLKIGKRDTDLCVAFASQKILQRLNNTRKERK